MLCKKRILLVQLFLFFDFFQEVYYEYPNWKCEFLVFTPMNFDFGCWLKSYIKVFETTVFITHTLSGHPPVTLPFVDVATGSLGQGLSNAAGMAWAAKHVDKVSCLGGSFPNSVWRVNVISD